VGLYFTDQKECKTIFGLIGKNEDALTYGLGYLFSKNKSFLIEFLKEAKIFKRKQGKNYEKEIKDYNIILQEHQKGSTGRKDIVIRNPVMRIVVEAKIGGAIPNAAQIENYSLNNIPEWKNHKLRKIVVLTKVPINISKEYGDLIAEIKKLKLDIDIISVQWFQIQNLVNKFADKEFKDYYITIKEDYKMKYIEEEVLIVKTIKGTTYKVCNQDGMGFYIAGQEKNKRTYRESLFFLACYGKQRTATKTGEYIRRIISHELMSAEEILALPDDNALKKAFINQITFFNNDKKAKSLHVFKLGTKIRIPKKHQTFKSAEKDYALLDKFLAE
jgi:hypothetical protein